MSTNRHQCQPHSFVNSKSRVHAESNSDSDFQRQEYHLYLTDETIVAAGKRAHVQEPAYRNEFLILVSDLFLSSPRMSQL